jgi:hypothetical protein
MRAGACRSALLAGLLCALAAACYSTSYRKELTANTALLAELADKLNDYCQVDFMLGPRPVSSEEMGEFDYALKKARAWAAMSESSAGGRASYRAFTALLSEYESFVREADRYRLVTTRDPAQLDALAREHEAVEAAARSVLARLRQEQQ